ncbi:MAG: hypothetical protein QOG43_3449 [Actinomycetota bacterium]|jgi:hypothetical protein|nr:hypothetical protein [Actinomycetota bacterium]
MKLDWDRAGVVQATLKVPELAALVAGARLAAAALATQSPDQADELERVLSSFDHALDHLRRTPPPTVPAPDREAGPQGQTRPADLTTT